MKNEKGLTLIELLAVLVILSIVSSVIFGIYISIQKNYQLQSNQNQLGQEANQIVTIIKNYHQKGTAYYISTNSNKLYIGNTTGFSNQALLSGSTRTVEIINLYQEDDIPFINTNGSGQITVDPSKPLFIKLKILDQNNKSILVDTIISNYKGG